MNVVMSYFKTLTLKLSAASQVDMYSFGVILWELITTEVPRRGRLRAIKVRQLATLGIPE